MKRLTKQLLDKSQEAFILALEIYNKPTIKYRIEGFCFFFSNAWELLLKSKILEDEKKERAIYYKKQRNQKRRSLSLRDCLKKVIPNESDSIRKNIEDIAAIRDEATHLIIKDLEAVYSGLFQSGVLNYVDKLEEWFGISITEKISPAMLTLVSDIKQIDRVFIKKRYGPEIWEFVENEIGRIEKNAKELKEDIKYRIPIKYKLVLTKSAKDADITLSSGVGGKTFGLIEVPKDIERTHPYLQKDIITKIKERIGEDVVFNQYDFQAILLKEKIKGNYKYHYMIKKPVIHRYSDALITFIIGKIEKDPNYLRKARKKLKKARKKYRNKKK